MTGEDRLPPRSDTARGSSRRGRRTRGAPASNGAGGARRRVPAALAVLLLAGCGASASPAEEFEVADDDERLLSLPDQRRAAAEDVTLPRGTQHLRVRVDCIGEGGEIRVEVDEMGAGAVPCGEVSSPDGFIGLSRLEPLPGDTPARVRITAPDRARWSAAVDAGPGRLPVDE